MLRSRRQTAQSSPLERQKFRIQNKAEKNCALITAQFKLWIIVAFWCLIFFGATTPSGPGPPHSRGFQITNNDAPQVVGLIWTGDQPDAETSTLQHTTISTHSHPCPRWDSNPQSQQASGRRPTPQTARPLGLAVSEQYIKIIFLPQRRQNFPLDNSTSQRGIGRQPFVYSENHIKDVPALLRPSSRCQQVVLVDTTMILKCQLKVTLIYFCVSAFPLSFMHLMTFRLFNVTVSTAQTIICITFTFRTEEQSKMFHRQCILTAQFSNGNHNIHSDCGEHSKSYEKRSMS